MSAECSVSLSEKRIRGHNCIDTTIVIQILLTGNKFKKLLQGNHLQLPIEQAMVTNMLSDNNRNNQTIICRIINVINIHRKVMELVRNFSSYVIIT